MIECDIIGELESNKKQKTLNANEKVSYGNTITNIPIQFYSAD